MTKTLRELAHELNGTVFGDDSFRVEGVAPLSAAQNTQISFVTSKKHLEDAQKSAAGAFILLPNLELPGKNGIYVKNPRWAMAKVAHLFYTLPRPKPGISEWAQMGQNVSIGKNVSIGPFVIIGDEVTIE